MQLISTNLITQGRHGAYNAVDIGPNPDPYYYAPEDGTVTIVDVVDDDTCGKRLKVKGATGLHGFCHNSEIYVKVGQAVKRGQKLAKMGYTGYTQPDNVPGGTHVHWILYRNGQYVYPPDFVNQPFIKLGATTGEAIVKPTKDEINNAFNLLGVPDSASHPDKNYPYYLSQDRGVLWSNVAKALHKRLVACQAEATPLVKGKKYIAPL